MGDKAAQKQEQKAIGARLRTLRESLGLTQEDAANGVNLQRTSIVAIEKGDRQVSATELAAFANLYRRPVAWILGQEEDFGSVSDALFRATRDLSAADKQQVLRFAEFLSQAGDPARPDKGTDS
ncbi:helix-turn-helix domain-containing protein [Leifsonia sp. NPDC102414]|uniref:helix-turn-helix domain-containing protein n=1 Tax=Leifsonia sp. NPDC102414 TaxID=3364124 RepID=UPI0037FE6F1F